MRPLVTLLSRLVTWSGSSPVVPSAPEPLAAEVIRPLQLTGPAPEGTEERLILAELGQGGALGIDALVDRVARALYEGEQLRGAWAADIGVFGPTLFESEVRRALHAGDGRLWTITGPPHARR